MPRSAFITWVLLMAAVFTAVNATGCYEYGTRAACVNKPCGYGSYKCYWARGYKRSADLPEGENPNLLEEADAEGEEVAEEKNKRLAPLNPDDPERPFQGYCDCCTLTCIPPKVLNSFACVCTCPYPIPTCTGGKVFDFATCQCKCPKYTYWDYSVKHCVGDCKKLTVSTTCTKIRCDKNKHLFCQYSYGSCSCPTCHNVYDYSWCVKTKCTYNWTPCVWDPYYYKCKCSY